MSLLGAAPRSILEAETYLLRRHVLGWGETSIPADSLDRVRHFGVRLGAGGPVIACASCGRSPFPGSKPVTPTSVDIRFWGVAVLPPFRGRGLGKQLMAAISGSVLGRPGGFLWANARVTAISFYQELEFDVGDAEFADPNSNLSDSWVFKALRRP